MWKLFKVPDNNLNIWIINKINQNDIDRLMFTDLKRFSFIRNRYPNPDLDMYNITLFLQLESVIKNIAKTDVEHNLILNENCYTSKDIHLKLSNIINELSDNYDICYIGDKKHGSNVSINKSFITKEKHIYKCIVTKGTESFLITKTFAKRLLEYIENKGEITRTMDCNIGDMILQENLNVYWCEPPLVKI